MTAFLEPSCLAMPLAVQTPAARCQLPQAALQPGIMPAAVAMPALWGTSPVSSGDLLQQMLPQQCCCPNTLDLNAVPAGRHPGVAACWGLCSLKRRSDNCTWPTPHLCEGVFLGVDAAASQALWELPAGLPAARPLVDVHHLEARPQAGVDFNRRPSQHLTRNGSSSS